MQYRTRTQTISQHILRKRKSLIYILSDRFYLREFPIHTCTRTRAHTWKQWEQVKRIITQNLQFQITSNAFQCTIATSHCAYIVLSIIIWFRKKNQFKIRRRERNRQIEKLNKHTESIVLANKWSINTQTKLSGNSSSDHFHIHRSQWDNFKKFNSNNTFEYEQTNEQHVWILCAISNSFWGICFFLVVFQHSKYATHTTT